MKCYTRQAPGRAKSEDFSSDLFSAGFWGCLTLFLPGHFPHARKGQLEDGQAGQELEQKQPDSPTGEKFEDKGTHGRNRYILHHSIFSDRRFLHVTICLSDCQFSLHCARHGQGCKEEEEEEGGMGGVEKVWEGSQGTCQEGCTNRCTQILHQIDEPPRRLFGSEDRWIQPETVHSKGLLWFLEEVQVWSSGY